MNLQDIKTYSMKVSHDNDYELIYKALDIYLTVIALIDGEPRLRKRCLEILTFYVLYDYSDKTKDMIKKTMKPKLTNKNLTQITYELTKSGLLLKPDHSKNQWNSNSRELSPQLIHLRKYFLEKDYNNLSMFTIGFNKKR